MSRQRQRLDNPDNITVTPRGGLLLCEDAGGRPTSSASGWSASRSTATRLPSRRTTSCCHGRHNDLGKSTCRQLRAQRMGRRLLQPRRQMAVREHPDARRDVRDHRAVGPGAALRTATSRRVQQPAGAVRSAPAPYHRQPLAIQNGRHEHPGNRRRRRVAQANRTTRRSNGSARSAAGCG